MFKKIKQFLLDLFFPKLCLGCHKEGELLCQDCYSTIEVFSFHSFQKIEFLDDLYFACPYNQFLLKKIICQFKYFPFLKELSSPLATLIIHHFFLLEKSSDFLQGKILIPIPQSKKRNSWRGFNPSEEIAKNLANFWKLPLFCEVLVKIKETKPQVKLNEKEREENIKDAFLLKEKEKIKNKEIFLIDDVFTTGSTMKEAARVLKEGGAKKVIGIAVARAKIGEDKIESY